jgi:hypothetical protein
MDTSPTGGGKTINQFCADWHISRGSFYNMRLRGEAPAMVKFGNVQRISHQAEAEWAREREAAAKGKAAA